jgi:hypothetical protein
MLCRTLAVREKFVSRGAAKVRAADIVSSPSTLADDIPVFLLDVYGKDAQANLSKAQRNELRKTLTALPRAWREQKRANTVKYRRRT